MTRLRDLGITIGDFPTGPHNAITDVAGVRVGYTTLIEGEGDNAARTGATAVLPHAEILVHSSNRGVLPSSEFNH